MVLPTSILWIEWREHLWYVILQLFKLMNVYSLNKYEVAMNAKLLKELKMKLYEFDCTSVPNGNE